MLEPTAGGVLAPVDIMAILAAQQDQLDDLIATVATQQQTIDWLVAQQPGR